MPRPKDETYIIDICDEILNHQSLRGHKFDFLLGSPGGGGRRTCLPVDAYYPNLSLVVEYNERQHSESVPFFDKRITRQGLTRGDQRKAHDQIRKDVLPAHGIKLIVFSYFDFVFGSAKRLLRHESDRETIRRRLQTELGTKMPASSDTDRIAALRGNPSKSEGAIGRQPENFAHYPSLQGQVVLITGGASGIGESMVMNFARQGAQVAFLDIQDEPAQQLVEVLTAEGCPAPHYLHCDVTDVAALARCIAEVIAALGPITVLVNNAANDQRHKTEEVTPEYWERSLQLNLRHHFFAIQAVLPGMKKARRGSIINMSSIAWLIPSTGMPLYMTAKAAIVGLTRTLAHEVGADGIRVNAVLPGAIATERQKQLWYTPEYKAEILKGQALKRDILPDDVARLVLFLAADDSSAITNQSYVVDGGWV